MDANEYYAELIKSNRCFENEEFLQEFFVDTEPRGERPTHSRILSTISAEASLAEFFQKMYLKFAINSAYEWRATTNGNALPSHKGIQQPLGYFAVGTQVPLR